MTNSGIFDIIKDSEQRATSEASAANKAPHETGLLKLTKQEKPKLRGEAEIAKRQLGIMLLFSVANRVAV